MFLCGSVEQCFKAASGHHGEPTWQWECRQNPIQHESKAVGVLLLLLQSCIFSLLL